MAGCLSSGRVSQLGRVASVMVDAPPPQSVSDRLHGDRLKSWSCSSHWASPNALSLQSPGRAHCPSLAQSQVQPSQVSGCRLNRAPGQAHPVGSDGQGLPPPPRLLASPGRGTAKRPASPLYLGISPFRGQQRSVWKCSSDSPIHRLNASSNPGLFSQPQLCSFCLGLSWLYRLFFGSL